MTSTEPAVRPRRLRGPGAGPPLRAVRSCCWPSRTRLEANAKYFLEVECRSTGKPLRQVRDDEIPQCVDFLRYFAGIARSLPGVAAMEYTEGATSYVRR